MKKYTVMIIGDSGKYETVASGVNGRLAGAIANDYTDKEIEEHGKDLAGELAEEYRFNANVNRYRNCGY